jgi:phage pi2 protein 07
MGAISFSLDIHLVEHFQESLPLSIFIETGTFEGDTLENVLPYFDKIFSVEIAEFYYKKSLQRFSDQEKISLFQGDSSEFLSTIHNQVREQSCLFWLDAHWCSAEATDDQISQCPLIQEIEAIQSLNENSIILIDDARLFVCPPPKPHVFNEWPRFSAILKALHRISQHHEITIYNDVLVYYPEKISDRFNQYAYENAVDWLQIKHFSSYFDSLRVEIESKDQEINNLARIADLRDQELQRKDQEIKNLADAADARGKEIMEKETALQEFHQYSQKNESSLQEKEQILYELSAAAQSRLEIINAQTQELVQRDLEIAQKSDELNQLKQKLNTLETKQDILEQESDALKKELSARESPIHLAYKALNTLTKKWFGT